MFYQRVSRSSLHCCVPRCSCSSRYSKVSFHSFPTEDRARQQWLANIRRENLSPRRNTRVCSRHFLLDDLVDTPGGRKWLKKGAVPVLFEWNSYSLPEKTQECAAADPRVDPVFVALDHDYCISPATGVMFNTLQNENEALRKKIEMLQSQVETLQLETRFGLERFAGSDNDIRFYTR